MRSFNDDVTDAWACTFLVGRWSVHAGNGIQVVRAKQSNQYLLKIYTLSTISTDFMFSWF